MFYKKKSLVDQTVEAVDRLAIEVDDLHEEQISVLGGFRQVADRLGKINESLAEKSALCGTLIAQLKNTQADIAQQTEDNAKVKEKILDIIGGPVFHDPE